jgi:hypothetical protein
VHAKLDAESLAAAGSSLRRISNLRIWSVKIFESLAAANAAIGGPPFLA